MKYSRQIFLLANIVIISFCSCNKQTEVRTIGYAYKGDSIILYAEQSELLSIVVDGVEDKNRICPFNKKTKFSSRGADATLTVVIDSSNIKVLDTFIVVPKNYKEPFISFVYPSVETKYRRKIFISDEADSSFHKE